MRVSTLTSFSPITSPLSPPLPSPPLHSSSSSWRRTTGSASARSGGMTAVGTGALRSRAWGRCVLGSFPLLCVCVCASVWMVPSPRHRRPSLLSPPLLLLNRTYDIRSSIPSLQIKLTRFLDERGGRVQQRAEDDLNARYFGTNAGSLARWVALLAVLGACMGDDRIILFSLPCRLPSLLLLSHITCTYKRTAPCSSASRPTWPSRSPASPRPRPSPAPGLLLLLLLGLVLVVLLLLGVR